MARPHGLPRAEHFELVSRPLPAPAGAELLVKNRYFRVTASLRMLVSEGAEAVEGVPFPALAPDDTLGEEAVGQIVRAPAGSDLVPGAWVLHRYGFREYAAVPRESCEPLDEPLPDLAAHLGHGWTAYAALTRTACVRDGDVVFVSSAAGAVGSLAAFIARRLGARRVIGSTSTHEKGARLVAELGYDAAVVREAGPILPQLLAAAPEGLDVVLDNVGGEQLAAAVNAARSGARLVVLGALSGQLAAEGTGRTAPVTLDSFPLLLKRLTLRGYSADDDPDARKQWERLFGDALRSGAMHFPHTRIHGIEGAPAAIEAAALGHYTGAVIVEL